VLLSQFHFLAIVRVRQHHDQARNGIQVAKVSVFFIEQVKLCLFAKYKMTPESS
jgi:hypothetical protein